MKPIVKAALAIVAVSLLAGCVAGSEESAHAASGGLIAAFALGFWHGLISPVTLLVEVLNALLPHVLPWKTHLYETQAAGAPYDVGFYLGFGGGPLVIWRGWRRR